MLFDTNVVESRYLTALLRGESCRDFAILREQNPPFRPSIYINTYHEICRHVKSGGKKFPWLTKELGYPGGIDEGRKILNGLPSNTSDVNLYWWFCMSEEWTMCDWEEEELRVRSLVAPSCIDSALRELRVRQDFTQWKMKLSAFCERIWDVLIREIKILTPYEVYGAAGEYHDEVFSLEQDLATRRLVPSEDFDIVVAALTCRAKALVTCDKALLSKTALSISLNYHTAFVHIDHLHAALAENFAVHWSSDQTSSQGPR